jgi:hypothetical protein
MFHDQLLPCQEGGGASRGQCFATLKSGRGEYRTRDRQQTIQRANSHMIGKLEKSAAEFLNICDSLLAT